MDTSGSFTSFVNKVHRNRKMDSAFAHKNAVRYFPLIFFDRLGTRRPFGKGSLHVQLQPRGQAYGMLEISVNCYSAVHLISL